MSMQNNSRRNFIKNTTLAGFAILADKKMPATNEEVKQQQLIFLFQGDSITDGNRGRSNDPNHIMGHGYAFSIASRVGAAFPAMANVFYNRGISGNKVTDLAERWQKDALDLKPDVLSILVGINDSSSVINNRNNVTVEEYETVYRNLITKTLAVLPNCLLVLCEPFILPVGKVKDNWDAYYADIKKRQEVVARLAKEYKTVFVPLQNVFDKEHQKARAADEYWMWDGVHPTYSGHELITKEWLKQVRKRLRFLNKI